MDRGGVHGQAVEARVHRRGAEAGRGRAFMQMYKSMEGMIGKIGKSPLMNGEA